MIATHEAFAGINSKQLIRAARLKERIQRLESKLCALLGTAHPHPADGQPRRHKMSRGGRKAIQAAQKARWAKIKASK